MSNLYELSQKIKNFADYKDALWEAELAAEDPVSIAHRELEELRAAYREQKLSYELNSARLKRQIQEAGQPTSKTERRRDFDRRMSLELVATRAARDAEIRAQIAEGANVARLMAESGVNNPVLFYSIKRGDIYVPEQVPNCEWEYHDHSGVHRYAMSPDRDYVKMHAVEGGQVAYYRYPGLEYVAGDRTSVGTLDAKRVANLISLLNGEYEGKLNLKNNPYKESK